MQLQGQNGSSQGLKLSYRVGKGKCKGPECSNKDRKGNSKCLFCSYRVGKRSSKGQEQLNGRKGSNMGLEFSCRVKGSRKGQECYEMVGKGSTKG
jgi:hypothetical protein